jgi:hypothetical protein
MPGIASAISRRCCYYIDSVRSHIVNCLDRCVDPNASAFYAQLVLMGYDANALVDVLPKSRLIYVCIPKCASTTIKATLSALSGREPLSFEELHKRRYSGLKSPYQVGPSTLCSLAHDAGTLRFSFVRNPYARLVSAWADKYKNKPLVGGDSFVDKYLNYRKSTDPALPEGAGVTLSFPDFVRFTTATADRRLDAHWQLQDDLLDMPGIKLDFIGKVESFSADYSGGDRSRVRMLDRRFRRERWNSTAAMWFMRRTVEMIAERPVRRADMRKHSSANRPIQPFQKAPG